MQNHSNIVKKPTCKVLHIPFESMTNEMARDDIACLRVGVSYPADNGICQCDNTIYPN